MGMPFLYGLTVGLSSLLIVLLLVWVFNFRDGLGWQSNPQLEFNWHPILMVLSFVILYGQGILIYRLLRNEAKRKLKLYHAALLIMALAGASIGLKAVFDSHNYAPKPIPNLYSLHSWIGLAAVIMFGLQWLCGFISFLFPGLRYSLRTAYMPLHIYGGLMVYILTSTASIMGILEKTLFTGIVNPMSTEGILMNCIGMIIACLAGIVLYILTREHYKRQPLPEDELLLADQLAD